MPDVSGRSVSAVALWMFTSPGQEREHSATTNNPAVLLGRCAGRSGIASEVIRRPYHPLGDGHNGFLDPMRRHHAPIRLPHGSARASRLRASRAPRRYATRACRVPATPGSAGRRSCGWMGRPAPHAPRGPPENRLVSAIPDSAVSRQTPGIVGARAAASPWNLRRPSQGHGDALSAHGGRYPWRGGLRLPLPGQTPGGGRAA
jgi:hypothetical protein